MQTILGAGGQIADELARYLHDEITEDLRLVSRKPVPVHETDQLCPADLTDADLRECDLTRADLGRARLQGTKLRGTDLRGASTDEVNWLAFELTGVRLDLAQAVQVARAHGALVAD